MPKMLSFSGLSSLSSASSSTPPRNRPSDKKSSRLSPTRLVPKGMKALVNYNHDKKRSVRPIQNSVASSITCTDFEPSDFEPSEDLSGLLDGELVPPRTNFKRADSLDSDSKPLRPYRRGSAAYHVQHLKSDYAEPSPLDAGLLTCSVNSSITFADFQDMSGLSGLLGEEEAAWRDDDAALPKPNMRRTASMDSDSKPLRPLRRESQFPGTATAQSIIPEHQYSYPEPTRTMAKRSGSLDSMPAFPTRRDSASVVSKVSNSSSSTNKSMDCSPCVPGRKSSVISLGYEVMELNKRTTIDDQPSMPNRKISIAHNSLASESISEEQHHLTTLEYESMEGNKRVSMDDQPSIPNRKISIAHNSLCSMGISEEEEHSTSLEHKGMEGSKRRSMDDQPSRPNRKVSIAHNSQCSTGNSAEGQLTTLECEDMNGSKGKSVDDQPSMPNRKVSIAHNSVCSKEEEEESISLERKGNGQGAQKQPTNANMMSVTSAVA